MMKLVVICALVACTYAAPSPAQEQQQQSMFEQAYDLYSSCANEADLAVCLKLKALGIVDRAARSAEIDIVDGLKIVKTEETQSSRAENARSLNDVEASLPAELEAREAAVDDALYDRAARFLSTHTVELSMPEEARSVGEARGKKKKKIVKSLLPILLLLKLKAAALIPILLIGLALLAFKALIASKLALIISAVLAVRQLLQNRQQTYEVVSHDVHPHHDEHHSSGWGRSMEKAYSAHVPATPDSA